MDYGLLDLIGGNGWPDNQKNRVINRYALAFIGYLNEKINAVGLGALLEDKFSRLVSRPGITEKRLRDFLQEQSPELSRQLIAWAGEFKSMFVLTVYQAKLAEVKKQSLVSSEAKESGADWEKVWLLARQGDWDQVIASVKALTTAPGSVESVSR